MNFIGERFYPDCNSVPGYYVANANQEFHHYFLNYRVVDPRFIPESPSGEVEPSKARRKLHMYSDLDLEWRLQNYTLKEPQLLTGGFPTRCKLFPEYAEVFDTGFWHHLTDLNPEAKEFVPAQQTAGASVFRTVNGLHEEAIRWRQCKRCPGRFPMSTETGDYIVREPCLHHPGKFIENGWECCGQMNGKQEGCVKASTHVWTGFEVGYNGPLAGYVETQPLSPFPSNNLRYGVYAVDCEMAFTKRGMDVIKVTVVSLSGQVIYDEYVMPEDEIVDYGSEIHGITEEQVLKARKSLWEVQRDLLQFIHAESILVGHGVNYDLRVLRIIHKRIIDTSYVFPHDKGLPRRRSLRTLAKCLLQLDIHAPGQIHDSIEDARAAMEVMLNKLEYDLGLYK